MTDVFPQVNEIISIEDDDDDSIDEGQRAEYQEMLEELGSFPDKVKINTLTMIAEDYADSESSAKAIYSIIRRKLQNTARDNMLPIVYVIDSILKNVKGNYLKIIENDAFEWIPLVYQKLHETQRLKLEKVWKTWNEFQLFTQESWKSMGRCFDDKSANLPNNSSLSSLETFGITRSKDGTLILAPNLRKEMQLILDDMQSGTENELEKVSLERLADLNPNLLGQIKTTAEESMRSQRSQPESFKSIGIVIGNEEPGLPPFFTETRSDQALKNAKEWKDLKNWDPLVQTHEVIRKLQQTIREGGSSDSANRYTKDEALQMTKYYAVVSATAMLLTSTLERVRKQDDAQVDKLKRNAVSMTGGSFAVDKNNFTNEGIKIRNEAVIGILYDIGLPFVSSVDGRRFPSQIDLSNHLDALFKRNQLEKSMARTEERGWFISESTWISGASETSSQNAADFNDVSIDDTEMENNDSNTVPADESRDRCVICGINFKMYFDNDDGIYKYSNCKEIEILYDDAVADESEMKLVHVSCWKGLGSPEVLTMDQALQ